MSNEAWKVELKQRILEQEELIAREEAKLAALKRALEVPPMSEEYLDWMFKQAETDDGSGSILVGKLKDEE